MVPSDKSSRVRLLISDFKQRAGRNMISSEDLCRYVSLYLGVSLSKARDLIMRATLREAGPTRRKT